MLLSHDNEVLSVIAETIAIKDGAMKGTFRPLTTVRTAQLQTNPNNSLLNDLERRYPGILYGSWAAADTFT